MQKTGILPWAGDYFIELQREPLRAFEAFLQSTGPCIISGCEVTSNANGTYNVAPGFVALPGIDRGIMGDGNTRRIMAMPFDGATGVAMPLYLIPSVSDINRVYNDGVSKPIAYSYKAVTSAVPSDSGYITLSAHGGPSWRDTIQDATHRLVSDAEKNTWGNKAEKDGTYPNMSVGNANTAEKAEQDADGNDISATYLRQEGDASNTTVAFTQASLRDNILSGESLKTIFGKIKKWLADLKTVAFTGKYADLSGTPESLPANGGHADTANEVVSLKPNQVTTNTIADSTIPGGKLVSDIVLPGTPQIGTPSALNGASQNVASVGNVNEAVGAVEIGGTNIYRDTQGTSDFYLSATGEMKYRRFLEVSDEAKRNLRGRSIAVSFDYILENATFSSGDNGFGFFVKYTDGTTTYVKAFLPAETTAVTKSGRFSVSAKVEDKEISTLISFQPYIYARTTSGTATMGRPKFEIGTKATQWSPNPEEIVYKKDLTEATQEQAGLMSADDKKNLDLAADVAGRPVILASITSAGIEIGDTCPAVVKAAQGINVTIRKTSSGFDVVHNLGNTEYFCQVTTKAGMVLSGVTPQIEKTSQSVHVHWDSGGSYAWPLFDIVIFQ